MRAGTFERNSIANNLALRLGLIGRGISLSRTPRMHETEAAAQGISCSYELLDLDSGSIGSLPQVLDVCEAEGFAGVNVTFPFKQAALPYLTDLSDEARQIGAVNTIVFRNGRRFGYNTDFWGFSESFRQGLADVSVNEVLLIGAGGAGAALAWAMTDLSVGRLLIADANRNAAARLASRIGPQAEPVDDLAAAAAKADGIINATPMGMAKLPGMPLAPELIEPRHWVADIVYFPLETAFLKAARAAGCRTLSGEGMAVFQAVRAFELFSGRAANPERMRATFKSLGSE